MKYYPKNLKELCDIIKHNNHITAIGSLHSFNNITENENIIDTSNFNKLLKIDTNNKTVETECGVKLIDFNYCIDKFNLALPIMGDFDEQTMAGIVSTCTHGSGINKPPVSDCVVEMKIIDSNGELKTINNEEELSAFKCSIGMTGIIYSITFQCVESFKLEEKIQMVDFNNENCMDFFTNNDYAEYWLLPYTSYANKIYRNNFMHDNSEYNMIYYYFHNLLEFISINIMYFFSYFIFLIPIYFKLIGFFNYFLPRTMYVDDSFKILPRQRATYVGTEFKELLYDIEYHFSIKYVNEVYNTLNNAIENLYKRNIIINWPINFRVIKNPGNILLAPYNDKIVLALSICVTKNNKNFHEALSYLEDVLIKKFNGLPHWGKNFYQNPLNKYNKLNEFNRIRKKYDNADKFVNLQFNNLFINK